jgi:hypothetical protein
MQRLKVSGAVRPLWWPLGVKRLIGKPLNKRWWKWKIVRCGAECGHRSSEFETLPVGTVGLCILNEWSFCCAFFASGITRMHVRTSRGSLGEWIVKVWSVLILSRQLEFSFRSDTFDRQFKWKSGCASAQLRFLIPHMRSLSIGAWTLLGN